MFRRIICVKFRKKGNLLLPTRFFFCILQGLLQHLNHLLMRKTLKGEWCKTYLKNSHHFSLGFISVLHVSIVVNLLILFTVFAISTALEATGLPGWYRNDKAIWILQLTSCFYFKSWLIDSHLAMKIYLDRFKATNTLYFSHRM